MECSSITTLHRGSPLKACSLNLAKYSAAFYFKQSPNILNDIRKAFFHLHSYIKWALLFFSCSETLSFVCAFLCFGLPLQIMWSSVGVKRVNVCICVCTIWILNNVQCHHRHLSALLPMWRSEQGGCTANAARQIHIWHPFIAACHVTEPISSNISSGHNANKEQHAWSFSTEVFKAINVISLYRRIYNRQLSLPI